MRLRTKPVPLRPCLVCGAPSAGPRCLAHPTTAGAVRADRKRDLYGGDYQTRRRQLLASALSCWVCGETARPDDPLEADHVGDELRAAHASCNRRRGGLLGNRLKSAHG